MERHEGDTMTTEVTDITPGSEVRKDKQPAPLKPEEPIAEHAQEKEEVEEIPPTDQALIMGRKKEFDDFYKGMKRYQDEHWTILQIEAQSKKLKEIFHSWREVLRTAGIVKPNKLIQVAINEARNMRAGGGLTFNFEKRMFTRAKMAEKTPILKFFKSFVKGLKGEMDEEAMAEEQAEHARTAEGPEEEQMKKAA